MIWEVFGNTIRKRRNYQAFEEERHESKWRKSSNAKVFKKGKYDMAKLTSHVPNILQSW